MRSIVVVAALLASCSSPSDSPLEAPRSTQMPPPAPVPARQLPLAPAWQWEVPPLGADAVSPSGPIAAGELRCELRYVEHRETDHLECLDPSGARVWGRDRARAFQQDAALLAHAETLFVARFSEVAAGCVVTAYELATGRERWSTPLLGVGNVVHSQSLNAVQLRWIDDRVVAFGRESAGQYVEALDPRTGARLAYRGPASMPDEVATTEPPIPGEAASFEWRWDGVPPDPQRPLYQGRITLSMPNGSCRFQRDERAYHLECTDHRSIRIWGDDVVDDASPDAALARDDTRVYVSRYSNTAAGTSVSAYDRHSGDRLWQTRLRGVGPIARSIDLHDEQLRLERGRLIVVGWELGARFVEVLDPATGRVLGSRVLAEGDTR